MPVEQDREKQAVVAQTAKPIINVELNVDLHRRLIQVSEIENGTRDHFGAVGPRAPAHFLKSWLPANEQAKTIQVPPMRNGRISA